jgi:hypothetical protein
MYRVTLSPKVADLEKNPSNVNQWLKTIEGRFNLYSSAADPTAAEVPIGQWVFHRNTATNATKLWTNWNGTLTQIGAGTVTSVTASAPLASSGGATPNITVPLTTGTGTTVVLDTAANVTDLWVGSGNLFVRQAAPTSKSAGATLTAAEIMNGICQYTGAGAANLTTPTATSMNNALPAQAANQMAYFWSVIATGAGAPTIVANTGVTLVGNMVVTAGTSGFFMIRRSTASAFIIYRLA